MSRVILLNKPYGVICQFSPEGNHPTLKSLVDVSDVYPAGRLDADSEGLVVLTDDGALQRAITHPSTKMEKTYLVQVEGTVTPDHLDRLSRGIRLRDYTTRPCAAQHAEAPPWLWDRVPPIRQRKFIPVDWLTISLTEGKNRQIRHMTATVGLPTLRLIRIRIGSWSVREIPLGQWRSVDATASVSPAGRKTRAPDGPGQPTGHRHVKLDREKLPNHRSRKEHS